MMALPPQPITTLLTKVRGAHPGAAEELIGIIYQDLRRLAANQFRGEQRDHTLQPTAVVHELYERLFVKDGLVCHDRAHLMAVAAQQIRRILVDHARSRRAVKRGGGNVKVTLIEVRGPGLQSQEDVLAIHEALDRLAELDKRAAQVVELRFFAGMEEKEIAAFLNISVSTAKRDWVFARAWLLGQLATSGE